jgi:hypothetical protein
VIISFTKIIVAKCQRFIQTKMRGGQNKFPFPPTHFETYGSNVTVCPENISCHHSGTFSITVMLSAYYIKNIT